MCISNIYGKLNNSFEITQHKNKTVYQYFTIHEILICFCEVFCTKGRVIFYLAANSFFNWLCKSKIPPSDFSASFIKTISWHFFQGAIQFRMETTQRSHRVHFSASCVVRVTYGNMDGCLIMKNCILRKDIFCYKSVDFFSHFIIQYCDGLSHCWNSSSFTIIQTSILDVSDDWHNILLNTMIQRTRSKNLLFLINKIH